MIIKWISNKKTLDFYLFYMRDTYTRDEIRNISQYLRLRGIKRLTIPMIENIILNEKYWRRTNDKETSLKALKEFWK